MRNWISELQTAIKEARSNRKKKTGGKEGGGLTSRSHENLFSSPVSFPSASLEALECTHVLDTSPTKYRTRPSNRRPPNTKKKSPTTDNETDSKDSGLDSDVKNPAELHCKSLDVDMNYMECQERRLPLPVLNSEEKRFSKSMNNLNHPITLRRSVSSLAHNNPLIVGGGRLSGLVGGLNGVGERRVHLSRIRSQDKFLVPCTNETNINKLSIYCGNAVTGINTSPVATDLTAADSAATSSIRNCELAARSAPKVNGLVEELERRLSCAYGGTSSANGFRVNSKLATESPPTPAVRVSVISSPPSASGSSSLSPFSVVTNVDSLDGSIKDNKSEKILLERVRGLESDMKIIKRDLNTLHESHSQPRSGPKAEHPNGGDPSEGMSLKKAFEDVEKLHDNCERALIELEEAKATYEDLAGETRKLLSAIRSVGTRRLSNVIF